jgi:hypothetical protein
MTTSAPEDGIITATEMEQATPPAGVQRSLGSTWTLAFESRERRRWTAALAGAVLISLIGLGVVYADDASSQAAVRSLASQNEQLDGRAQLLQNELAATQANLTATLAKLADTQAQLAHPQLGIWNVPQRINGSNSYLAGTIPDTFTYHLQATSTGPMSVSILTLEQWAKAIECVDSGRGSVNYCMHNSGAVLSWLNVTSVDYEFHYAEGCADYMAVFTSATTVTVRPDVSVTYNPASSSTGACA